MLKLIICTACWVFTVAPGMGQLCKQEHWGSEKACHRARDQQTRTETLVYLQTPDPMFFPLHLVVCAQCPILTHSVVDITSRYRLLSYLKTIRVTTWLNSVCFPGRLCGLYLYVIDATRALTEMKPCSLNFRWIKDKSMFLIHSKDFLSIPTFFSSKLNFIFHGLKGCCNTWGRNGILCWD